MPLDMHPDCPVCCDNWVPMPVCGHSLPDAEIIEVNLTNKPIAKHVNEPIYFCIRESLSPNEIKKMVDDVNKSTKPVCIDVAWYFKKSSQEDVLRILSTIDKKRIIALAVWFPSEDHCLTENDETWILSLINIRELYLHASNVSDDFLRKVGTLKNLIRFQCNCFDTRQKTSILLKSISDHPSLEFFSLVGGEFSDNIDWRLGKKVKRVILNHSRLTTSAIRTIGQSSSVLHIEIINCKFPSPDKNTEIFFHSKIRCLGIHGDETNNHDRQLSLRLLDNLEKFPELKMLMVKISKEDFPFVKNKIYRSNNIIRILLFFEDIQSPETDNFISSIRKDRAIYAGYYSTWLELLWQTLPDANKSIGLTQTKQKWIPVHEKLQNFK
jgi:hypothetical protein